ncbi:hypothetical protein ACLOJK_013182 [Asimina triloba]
MTTAGKARRDLRELGVENLHCGNFRRKGVHGFAFPQMAKSQEHSHNVESQKVHEPWDDQDKSLTFMFWQYFIEGFRFNRCKKTNWLNIPTKSAAELDLHFLSMPIEYPCDGIGI